MNNIETLTVKHYSPNMTYIARIDDDKYYVGCHTSSKEFLYPCQILNTSGNHYAYLKRKGKITLDEFNEKVKVIKVFEFDTPEDALKSEESLIKIYKLCYGDKCINKRLYANNKGKGYHMKEETKRKIAESRKGFKQSEETKAKISKARTGQRLSKEARLRICKPVLDTETGKVYPSMEDLCKELGVTRSSVYQGWHRDMPKYRRYKHVTK